MDQIKGICMGPIRDKSRLLLFRVKVFMSVLYSFIFVFYERTGSP